MTLSVLLGNGSQHFILLILCLSNCWSRVFCSLSIYLLSLHSCVLLVVMIVSRLTFGSDGTNTRVQF